MSLRTLVPTAVLGGTMLAAAVAFSAPEQAPASQHAEPSRSTAKTYTLEVVVSESGILLDFAGAAEVFRETADTPFRIAYVADSLRPVTLKGGLRIIPTYTFDDAPQPDYVLLGSQGTEKAPGEAIHWLQAMHGKHTTLVSVCTGSDWLAQAGLLDNKEATTHHLAYGRFRQTYSKVHLVEGKRYMQSDPYTFTGGGFYSGMDVALHVIDVRFGRDIARRTADRLEYRGTGWLTNENGYSGNAGR